MRDKVIFGVTAVVISLGLYAALWWARSLGRGVAAYDMGFLVPALALILAARGFGWRRKLAFVAATAAGPVLIEAIATATHVRAAATLGIESTAGAVAGGMIYSALIVGYPLAMLVLFVGRRPTLLWSGGESAASGKGRVDPAQR